MKKLLSVLLIALMAITLVACSSSKTEETAEETTTEEPSVTITVGISPDYPPYESLDTDGSIIGFDAEMVKLFEQYMTEETGVSYTFEFKQMDFDNIITQIQGGQVEVGISGFTYSEDRTSAVDFSDPYCLSKQVAVVLAGSEFTSVEQLKGKHLVAQSGSTGEYAAQDLSDDTTGLKNAQDMMTALDAGQYDAAVLDSGVANAYASSGKYTILPETLVDEANYIVVQKGDAQMLAGINTCIAKFVASDEYKTLCEEYQLSPIEQ